MPSNDSLHGINDGHWERMRSASLASRLVTTLIRRFSAPSEQPAPRSYVDFTTVENCICFANDSTAEAARLMWKYECKTLPVMGANHELVGTVTDRDLCMAAYIKGRPLDEITVGEVMSSEVSLARPRREERPLAVAAE